MITNELIAERNKLLTQYKELEEERMKKTAKELRNIHSAPTVENKNERGDQHLASNYHFAETAIDILVRIVEIDSILLTAILT